MKTLKVNALSATYDIIIEKGILSHSADYLTPFVRGNKVMIITDSNVKPLYLDTLKRSFENTDFEVFDFVFTAGEQSKHLGTVADIYDALSSHNFTRHDMLVALGGGVCGDITGFAAATYMRGIDFVQVPTTLLSQVDSSVGGKTGVDTKFGKNLVGAFYQPKAVLIDPLTLDTLSPHYFADGMGEVIKYGCIRSNTLFEMLERVDVKEQIEDIILKCLKIKRDVVECDERESGLRMILNFGHTLGHSIEKLSDFTLSHGECVAKGMVMITRASEKLGMTKSGSAQKIADLCAKYNLNTDIPYSVTDIAIGALNDKKSGADTVSTVLLKDIGECFIHKICKDNLADFIK